MSGKKIKTMAVRPGVHLRFKAEAKRQKMKISELHENVLSDYVEKQAADRKAAE